MGKTISIDRNASHKVSEVICVKCAYRWLAVRPTDVKLKNIECKYCGAGFVIETGEIIN